MMKKEQKQIMSICAFLIIGCVLGYFVATNQMNQLSDPEYIAFWTNNNMPVPEPLGYTNSILSFALLFSGIPIYTCIGIVGSIPFIIYKGIQLIKGLRGV